MANLKTILLVDDDPLEADLAIRALRTQHLANQVVVVEDGEEALDYLHRRGTYATRVPGNPVLVLLDRNMPRLDGIEVLREIRATENLKLVPVVMLTSSNEEKHVLESYDLGIKAYIVKSVDFHYLVQTVKDLSQNWESSNETPPRVNP
ncbi:MAG TPA: response regulator [Patescibacteria group bacterium]|jgi:CheY-like chemotaxis protein|nr:response regulator [Patescibacteria group bacterium]